jgi:hypothetical protein
VANKRKSIILLILLFSLTVYPVLATTIFSDGFESGNFNAWTGTNGSPTIVASPVHHGSYSALFDAEESVYTDYAEQTTVYKRVYVYFPSVTFGGSYQYQIFLTIRKGNTDIAKLSLHYNSGTNYDWYLAYYYPSLNTASSASFTPIAEQWYCVELLFVRSATVGQYQVWVDGSSVINVAGLDTSGISGASRILIGTPPGSTFRINTNIDCVVVADVYIGPEVSGQDLTFQLSQTIHLMSSLTENQEKRFSLSEIAYLTSSIVKQKELGFPLSVTVKATSSLTMNKEIVIVIHEWLYSLQETAHLTSNLYATLEIAEKVSLGIGFYIGVLALVIALMAYLRSRH